MVTSLRNSHCNLIPTLIKEFLMDMIANEFNQSLTLNNANNP